MVSLNTTTFFAKRVLSVNGNHDFRLDIRVLDHHLAKYYQFSEALTSALGPPRAKGEELTQKHWDIAASAQKVLEDTALHLLSGLYEQTGSENLCMAGGVAFNSVMNGRIMTETPFKRFFIQPAAGDAGCSLGAALLVWHSQLQQPRKFQMEHAYYGPGFSSEGLCCSPACSGIEISHAA